MPDISFDESFVWYFANFNAPKHMFDKKKDVEISHEVALRKFTRHWRNGMQTEVINVTVCATDVAWEQLELDDDYNLKKRRHFKRDQEHRQFRYHNMSFIAQIDDRVVNQIWFVPSRDYDPLKICVTFKNEQAKERFISLSTHDDPYGNKLLTRLVKDYMAEKGKS